MHRAAALSVTLIPFDEGTIFLCQCTSTAVSESEVDIRKFLNVLTCKQSISYSISLDEFITKAQIRERIDTIYPNLWKDGIFEDEEALMLKARRIAHTCTKDQAVTVFYSDITEKSVAELMAATLQCIYNVTIEEILLYLKAVDFAEMNAPMIRQIEKILLSNESKKKEKRRFKLDENMKRETFSWIGESTGDYLAPSINQLKDGRRISSGRHPDGDLVDNVASSAERENESYDFTKKRNTIGSHTRKSGGKKEDSEIVIDGRDRSSSSNRGHHGTSIIVTDSELKPKSVIPQKQPLLFGYALTGTDDEIKPKDISGVILPPLSPKAISSESSPPASRLSVTNKRTSLHTDSITKTDRESTESNATHRKAMTESTHLPSLSL